MPSLPAPDEPQPEPPSANLGFRLGALGLAIALVAGGAIVFLVTRSSSTRDRAVVPTDVSAPDTAVIGQRAPGFVMPNLSGSGDLQFSTGTAPTVLTFWASWCNPCRKEFPLLERAERDDPSLKVFGVVYKDIPSDARRFAADEGADWSNVLDPSGDVASAYGVRAIPQTFFIDRNGVIVSRVFGIATAAQLDAELKKIR